MKDLIESVSNPLQDISAPIFDVEKKKLLTYDQNVCSRKWKHIRNDYQILSADEALYINTSVKPIILTFPANPKINHCIDIIDYNKTWSYNNVIIRNNGNLIMGLNENFICDVSGAFLKCIFNKHGWFIRWKVYPNIDTYKFKPNQTT